MIEEFLAPLLDNQGPVSISFYAPLERPFGETEKFPVQLSAATKVLESKLESAGLKSREIGETIEALMRIIEETNLAQHQVGGLAVFISGSFRSSIHLPCQFDSLVFVGNTFNLRQLIHVTQNNRGFYIAALSQENPRLYKADKFTIEEVPLSKETPKSLSAAIRYDAPERQIQHQTVAGAARGTSPIYHGHSAKDNKTKNLQRFFGLVDQGVFKAIEKKEMPVILAGLDSYLQIYKQKTDIPNILEKGIEHNVDDLKPEEIHQLAWEIIELEMESPEENAIKAYNNLLNDQRTTNDLSRIALASAFGQVDTLIAEQTQLVWGLVKPDENMVKVRSETEKQSDDSELVNFCIRHTLLNGGKVFVLKSQRMPFEDRPVLAILRY